MKTLFRILFWIGLVVLAYFGIKAFKRSRRNRVSALDQAALVADVSKVDNQWVKISGVTFEGRQRLLEQLYPKEILRLTRMPVDGHPEGVAVFNPAGVQLGFISIDRGMAIAVSHLMDNGFRVNVVDFERVGGETDKPRLGLRIKLSVVDRKVEEVA